MRRKRLLFDLWGLLLDILEWAQIVSAVLFGNMLTGWFGHSLWTVSKVEKSGLDASHAPWGALMGLICPPLAAAAALYFVTV